eukprot:TRINITY_DN7150_c1_g1_i1.p1 TRINITY_DN7150_c1_g1~~TRINITY_DN7150_c1_g1_i1.p1  ORF type:complete len:343 (+),score=85.75 TRINITY_DN7150_c1_g1_i1:79-1029(+)
MSVGRLQQRYPHLSAPLLQYVLHEVSGGNERLADDSLKYMTPQQLADLQASLSRGSRSAQLTPAQQSRVGEFCGIAGAAQSVAVRLLSQNGWNLEAALNVFFQGGGDAAHDHGKLTELFDACKRVGQEDGGGTSDCIQGNGLVHLCEQIGVEPYGDPLILIFAWLVRAQESYQFARGEFIDGLAQLGCRSAEDIKQRISEWRREPHRDAARWRDFYRFCFEWSKPAGQRGLPPEDACELWKLLLQGEKSWPLLPEWCEWVQTKHKRAISKDVWHQFSDFARLRPDFADYDAVNGAWPVLFDEFVEHIRAARQQGKP